jgi:hypothetical protein
LAVVVVAVVAVVVVAVVVVAARMWMWSRCMVELLQERGS